MILDLSCPLKMLPCVLSWKRNPADSNITMIWSINDSKMWRLAIRIGLGTNSPSLPAVSFSTELLISPLLLRFSGLFKTIIRNVIYLVIGMVKNINPSGFIYRYQQWLLGFDISTGRKTFDHGKHIKQFQY